MLAPDDKNTVLSEVGKDGRKARAYSAYGYSADDASARSGLGYNGELRDSATGYYFLGKGYRVFSPVMMRFYSPDSWSPFGEGGVNAYAYVSGNPVKYGDPTGHTPMAAYLLAVAQGLVKKSPENLAAARLASNTLKLQQEDAAKLVSSAIKDVSTTNGMPLVIAKGEANKLSKGATIKTRSPRPRMPSPERKPRSSSINMDLYDEVKPQFTSEQAGRGNLNVAATLRARDSRQTELKALLAEKEAVSSRLKELRSVRRSTPEIESELAKKAQRNSDLNVLIRELK